MMGWLSFLQQAPARIKLGGEGGWERSRGVWCVLRLALLMIASQINKSESSNMPLQPLLWAGSWRACVANAFSNAGGKPSLCSGRGACGGVPSLAGSPSPQNGGGGHQSTHCSCRSVPRAGNSSSKVGTMCGFGIHSPLWMLLGSAGRLSPLKIHLNSKLLRVVFWHGPG